jgi:uncharacterized protein (DUF2461 family)
MITVPPNVDVQRMLCSPGSVKDRDIRAALEERGWVMWRSKNEQIWMNGPRMIRVLYSFKSKWTEQRSSRS